ncbi:YceD family protein [Streptococcus suis]|uniref:YceD family protein n=1 Tax=Streptococcus suis TaxID=1307 RepID=UPI001C93B59E|nr:YceD family protein [Streptococcus suis]MBY4990460.1 YceD family protein [Streptococcus suis]
MFHIYDIQKNPDGISFDKTLDLQEELQARNGEVLGLSPVQVTGNIRFESGFFFLDYQMTYDITLASSRSLQPVLLHEVQNVNELFVANEAVLKEQDLIDEDMVLVVEDDLIVLDESVADNILLAIPIKVLTPEEEAVQELPSGQAWALMTEEDFQQKAQEKKEANSPFAQLQGLFGDED